MHICKKNLWCVLKYFGMFFFPHEIQCFRLQVVFFSLSFCLHLIANAICNYGNVEHGYHGAHGWYCIAQICNGTMYIRFTLTLICWICMFGILLGFYNIIMHTPFLLGLRCHYTNVGSVPKQMLNELMIACMLMFMLCGYNKGTCSFSPSLSLSPSPSLSSNKWICNNYHRWEKD